MLRIVTAALVLNGRARRLFPFIERIYGEGGYQGRKAAKAVARTDEWMIEINNYWFRSFAQAMDRGANLRLDQSQSSLSA